MKKFLFSLATLICICTSAFAQILVEAESFEYKGGWVADHQAFEKIRSSYLLAHGLGRPVADADTELAINTPGSYHIYVSTYNWTSPGMTAKVPGHSK